MYYNSLYEDIPNRKVPKTYKIIETAGFGTCLNFFKNNGRIDENALKKLETLKQALRRDGSLGSAAKNHPLNTESQLRSQYGLSMNSQLYDCHIRGDLLLFYFIDHDEAKIYLIALGIHNDFKKKRKKQKDSFKDILKGQSDISFSDLTIQNEPKVIEAFAQKNSNNLVLIYDNGNKRICPMSKIISKNSYYMPLEDTEFFKTARLDGDFVKWDDGESEVKIAIGQIEGRSIDLKEFLDLLRNTLQYSRSLKDRRLYNECVTLSKRRLCI